MGGGVGKCKENEVKEIGYRRGVVVIKIQGNQVSILSLLDIVQQKVRGGGDRKSRTQWGRLP